MSQVIDFRRVKFASYGGSDTGLPFKGSRRGAEPYPAAPAAIRTIW